MRFSLRLLMFALCCVGLFARPAQADAVLDFAFSYADLELSTAIGSTATARHCLCDGSLSTVTLDDGSYRYIYGELTYTTGLLSSFENDIYQYADGGTLFADVSVYDDLEHTRFLASGQISGSLGPVRLRDDESLSPFNGPFMLDLQIDPTLAALFGTGTHALGLLTIHLDFKSSDFGQPVRQARAYGSLSIQAVPEPSLLALLPLGFAALAYRHRYGTNRDTRRRGRETAPHR